MKLTRTEFLAYLIAATLSQDTIDALRDIIADYAIERGMGLAVHTLYFWQSDILASLDFSCVDGSISVPAFQHTLINAIAMEEGN